MFVKDRKLLAKLMAIEGVSARRLAQAAGWSSHSYMNRLLSGRAQGVSRDAATRIADHLGVPVAALFVDPVSRTAGRRSLRRRAKRVPAPTDPPKPRPRRSRRAD